MGYEDSHTDESIGRLIVELHDGSIVDIRLDVIMLGFDDGPTEESSEGDTLGRDDNLMDGASVGTSDGFTIWSEVGMDDGMQDGIAVGSSLGL